MKTYLPYFEFVDLIEDALKASDRLSLEDDVLCIESKGERDVTCRLPLILRQRNLTSLSLLQEEIDHPSYYAIILIQAGRASLAEAQADEIICSKQIQKYMVRKTQGKAQITYLNQKGKSRLGSRIRLRQTAEFFQEINERLLAWKQQYELKQLFLSCTPKLKGAWLSTTPSTFEKKDPRWRRVPFMVNQPGKVEMHRIHALLCRATLECPEAAIHDER